MDVGLGPRSVERQDRPGQLRDRLVVDWDARTATLEAAQELAGELALGANVRDRVHE